MGIDASNQWVTSKLVYVLRILNHLLKNNIASKDYAVKLYAIDKASDIAIFRLSSDTAPAPTNTMKISDLSIAPVTSEFPKGELVWTVGYVGSDRPLVPGSKHSMLLHTKLPPEERLAIMNNPAIDTDFKLYLHQYVMVLSNQKQSGGKSGKDGQEVIRQIRNKLSPQARFPIVRI